MSKAKVFAPFSVLVALTLSFIGVSAPSRAQSVDLIDVPAPAQPASTADSTTTNSDQTVTWRQLPVNFLRDQKAIWLFPTQVAKGHHWLPSVLLAGGTAGLIAADPQVMPHFRQTDTFHKFNNIFSGTTTGGFIAAVPAGFYAVSLARKNAYDQSTSLLAGEAVADDAVLMLVMKAITQRARPNSIPVHGSYSDTFYRGSVVGSSFPSGHALMSFSVATVFARRYRQHRWLPCLAYGLATAISFSRVTTGAHFPSDVLFGAAAGFAIARFQVLHSQ